MNKVNVGLGGISRNTDDGVSKDGMCSELINARPKNGSIEPLGGQYLNVSLQRENLRYLCTKTARTSI